MRFDALDATNYIGEADIDDGYNGKKTHVSIHFVDGVEWWKTSFGCFPAPYKLPGISIGWKNGINGK